MKQSVSSRSAVRAQTKKRGTSQTKALSAARLDAMHDLLAGTRIGVYEVVAPIGSAFGFEARGQLWRVSRDGGPPARIGAVPEFGFSSSVAWLRDGRLVFTTGGSGLLHMPVTGGEAAPMFSLDTTKDLDIHDVSALPDRQSLLYVVHAVNGPWRIEMFSLADSSRRTVYTAAGSPTLSSPVCSSTGHVVFERQAGIGAVPLSVRDRQPTGEPFLVLADARLPSVAADGTLVMLPGGLEADAGLAWIDRAGKVVRTISEPRGTLVDPRLSPDGRSAIATRGSRTDSDPVDLRSRARIRTSSDVRQRPRCGALAGSRRPESRRASPHPSFTGVGRVGRGYRRGSVAWLAYVLAFLPIALLRIPPYRRSRPANA